MATSPHANDTGLTSDMFEELEVSRQEEIDLLEAIYITELTLGKNESRHVNTVTLLLHPATGDNAELQYVCLTLEFHLPPEYPMVCPDMTIRNPRGLSDEHLTEVRDGLHKLAEDRKGNPMLYELIEYVKESLTQSNVPHGSCIICLEPFNDGQAFTKTACYHYFHTACLVRYIQHSLSEMENREKEAQLHQHLNQNKVKDVVCPICRVTISYDPDIMANVAGSDSSPDLPPLSEDIRRMQADMAKLFQKQKEKGGIIDLEEEKNKYLVTRDTVLIIPAEPAPSSSCQSDASPEDLTEDVSGKKNNRRRAKKPGKSAQDETRSKGFEKSGDQENVVPMSKEEADLNKRRLMNQRRRNNQQQLRNQQRNTAKEESHKDSNSLRVSQEEVLGKMEQLHLEKNGADSCSGQENVTAKDSFVSDNFKDDIPPLEKTSDSQMRAKADMPKKSWGYREDKGRFPISRGRGRGRGADKSWAHHGRDDVRNDSIGQHCTQGEECEWPSNASSQDVENKHPSRSQGRPGRGRASMSSQGASDKHQRAAPGSHNGSSRYYHQRDYRQQHGSHNQQRAPRHQKYQWNEGGDDTGGQHHYDGPYWDDSDQFSERGHGGSHGQDSGRPHRKSQDYYGQRNPHSQHGRGYRGSYYHDKYNSSSDYSRANGYKEEKHLDSTSDKNFNKDRMDEHYGGNRQTGGFGRHSQNMSYSSNGSR